MMPTSPEKHAKYMRDRYKNDPEFRKRAIQHTQKSKKRYDVEKKQLVLDFKSKGCIKCKEKEVCCLVAHHLDPKKKKFGLGMSYYQSLDDIKLELEKCVCLCSNCHMKFHAGIITSLEPAELGNGGD